MSESEYARGLREGRVEARLDSHDERFEKLNGSLGRHAAATEKLAIEIAGLASNIRTLEESGKLAAERVETTRKTLAEETERRKDALEVTADELTLRERGSDRKWTKWQQAAALAVAISAVIVTILIGTGKI